jgi:hypothetical protein
MARSRGLTVITGNLGEFGRVEGLRAEDWLTGCSEPPLDTHRPGSHNRRHVQPLP